MPSVHSLSHAVFYDPDVILFTYSTSAVMDQLIEGAVVVGTDSFAGFNSRMHCISHFYRLHNTFSHACDKTTVLISTPIVPAPTQRKSLNLCRELWAFCGQTLTS